MVEEQSNVDAHEILMITDAVQCRSCYKNATLGHTYCECGLTLPGVSEEVTKQVQKRRQVFHDAHNMRICFQNWKGKTVGCSEDCALGGNSMCGRATQRS